MKKSLFGAIVGLMLALPMSGAIAAPATSCSSNCYINFIEDPAEIANVTVQFDAASGFVVGAGLSAEYAKVTGSLRFASSDDFYVTGTSAAVLFEPGTNSLTVSDYFLLTISAAPSETLPTQTFEIEFFSQDILLDVLESQLGLGSLTGIEEDGTLQELSQFLGTSFPTNRLGSDLIVRAQSDVERVPEPTSLALLGLALAGLGWSRRRKV